MSGFCDDGAIFQIFVDNFCDSLIILNKHTHLYLILYLSFLYFISFFLSWFLELSLTRSSFKRVDREPKWFRDIGSKSPTYRNVLSFCNHPQNLEWCKSTGENKIIFLTTFWSSIIFTFGDFFFIPVTVSPPHALSHLIASTLWGYVLLAQFSKWGRQGLERSVLPYNFRARDRIIRCLKSTKWAGIMKSHLCSRHSHLFESTLQGE